MDRMTWIKPSFLWMMYRTGWATKVNQDKILAIDIKREGFDYMCRNAVLSSYDNKIYQSYDEWKVLLKNTEVRCQWDPERDIFGKPLDRRSIQLGIKGEMVEKYINEWIVNISDITDNVINLRTLIKNKTFEMFILHKEKEYIING